MKHISVLVPEGVLLGTVEGARLLFTEINQYLEAMGREALFEVKLVGLKKEVPVYNGMYSVHTDALIDEIKKTDLIVIPALEPDFPRNISRNQDFVPWLIKQYNAGTELASLCVGAFLLASTGLVNGRKCATHCLAANDFRKMFPDVDLVEDKIITDEYGIYSSGGAFSYLNLLVYLIEKYAGREVAVLCSKAFQIDIERQSQSPFNIFRGQKTHDDEPIKKVQEFIETNIDEKLTVDQLASTFALGRRNLERRFKKATSNTVIEYVQRVKIEAAKMSLESSRDNVNEVMYKVGYNDVKAFRNIFKKITGLSPVQYRNKYNRESLPA